jgi:hypothetical protein
MMTDTPKPRRPGRPRTGAQRMVIYSITLPQEAAEAAQAHGDGNLSAGVRSLIDRYLLRRSKPAPRT